MNMWIWPAAFLIWLAGWLFGLWLGWGWGYDHGYKGAEEDAAEDEAEARAEAMARRTHPVYRHPPVDQFSTYAHAAFAGAIDPPEVHHELSPGAWIETVPAPAYESDEEWMARNFAADHAFADQPMTEPAFPPWSLLNADPPTFDEEIQAMIANANANPSVRWLDQLPAGELRDRQ